jgi:hypothetical protein
MVLLSFPLGEIIRNRDTNDRIVKWSVKLGEFDIEFCPWQAIKSQILADFCLNGQKSRCPLPRSGLNIG